MAFILLGWSDRVESRRVTVLTRNRTRQDDDDTGERVTNALR